MLMYQKTKKKLSWLLTQKKRVEIRRVGVTFTFFVNIRKCLSSFTRESNDARKYGAVTNKIYGFCFLFYIECIDDLNFECSCELN